MGAAGRFGIEARMSEQRHEAKAIAGIGSANLDRRSPPAYEPNGWD